MNATEKELFHLQAGIETWKAYRAYLSARHSRSCCRITKGDVRAYMARVDAARNRESAAWEVFQAMLKVERDWVDALEIEAPYVLRRLRAM